MLLFGPDTVANVAFQRVLEKEPAKNLELLTAENLFEWLHRSTSDLEASVCSEEAWRLCEIIRDEVMRANLDPTMRIIGLRKKEKLGEVEALHRTLAGISDAASCLANGLRDLRHESLVAHFEAGENRKQKSILSELHEAFLFRILAGANIPGKGEYVPGEKGAALVASMKELVTPLSVDDSLRLLSRAARRALNQRAGELSRRGRRRGSKATLIRALSETWMRMTGQRATARGDEPWTAGRISEFQHFYSLFCGHLAGVLYRKRLGRRKRVSAPEEEALKAMLKELGIRPVPSASTIRRYMG